jgi:hypothetical protein
VSSAKTAVSAPVGVVDFNKIDDIDFADPEGQSERVGMDGAALKKGLFRGEQLVVTGWSRLQGPLAAATEWARRCVLRRYERAAVRITHFLRYSVLLMRLQRELLSGAVDPKDLGMITQYDLRANVLPYLGVLVRLCVFLLGGYHRLIIPEVEQMTSTTIVESGVRPNSAAHEARAAVVREEYPSMVGVDLRVAFHAGPPSINKAIRLALSSSGEQRMIDSESYDGGGRGGSRGSSRGSSRGEGGGATGSGSSFRQFAVVSRPAQDTEAGKAGWYYLDWRDARTKAAARLARGASAKRKSGRQSAAQLQDQGERQRDDEDDQQRQRQQQEEEEKTGGSGREGRGEENQLQGLVYFLLGQAPVLPGSRWERPGWMVRMGPLYGHQRWVEHTAATTMQSRFRAAHARTPAGLMEAGVMTPMPGTDKGRSGWYRAGKITSNNDAMSRLVRNKAPVPTPEDYYDDSGERRAPDIFRFEVVVEHGGYVDWSLTDGPLSFDEWMKRADQEASMQADAMSNYTDAIFNLSAGTLVQLKGLEKTPKFNGKRGVVVRMAKAQKDGDGADAFEVRLDDGEVRVLRAKNLQRVDD